MWRRGGHGGAVAAAPLQRQRGPEETPLPVEFPAAEDRGAEEPPFDDSDLPDQLQGTNGSQRFRNITTSFANQLLLVSLLEHLCHMYTEDPARSRRLFQLLCKTFIGMRLLSDFAVLEEFSSLRLQHKRAITELMKAAKKQIINEEFGKGDCNTNREKEIIFEAQTSRYINEFDELSRLGEGGYGTVFKVRNKLDGQFYAIKKILIKKATKRDCMKVLREVKVLAGLQHPNIVGYHTAWMEHVQPTGPKGEHCLFAVQRPPVIQILMYATALSLPSLKMPSGQSGSEIQDTEDSGSIVFADLTSGDSVGKTQEQNKMNSCTLSTESHESSSINDTESNSTHGEHKPSLVSYHSWDRCNNNTSNSYCGEKYPQKDVALQQQCEVEYHLMLHIQMQLCEISLWDWIVDRNKTCKNSEDASSIYQHIDNHWTLKIFQELLEGVYYIHSMGVMHRDIKPRNIFLQGSDHHVKIGDFGLACKDIIQEDTAHLLNAKKLNGFSHTSGVGTCLYASPEQLQGSHYDFKSDMYSLGIILLELFQPFGTEMERTKVLMGVRNGNIPPAFSRKWPVQTKYVKLLTNSVSSQRPTAIQLLESELFNNAANVICTLQQKVMQQEEEIKLLKEKVQLLLQEKDERDRIKQLGSPV